MSKRRVNELLDRSGGMLKLKPAFVHRFYPDLNRLGQKKLKASPRQNIPERWIGSSVEAINPPPIPGGGLSMIDTRDGGSVRALYDPHSGLAVVGRGGHQRVRRFGCQA